MSYRGPGVYIKEVNLPSPLIIPGGLKTVAVVGEAPASYKVTDQAVVRGVTTTDVITGTVTGEVSSVIGVGSMPGLYDYIVSTDYTIADNTIIWSGGEEPSAAVTYYVTYMKVKSSAFYDPALFTSLDDVRAVYGSELSGGILSEVSLGAALAFGNGCSQVLCVQQTTNSLTDEKAAIDKLQNYDIDILCAPGMTSTAIHAYILAHCNMMSSDTMRKERIAIISGEGLSDSVSTIKGIATAMASERMTVLAPPQVRVTLQDDTTLVDTQITVPGGYAGCGIGGIMTDPNLDEATPLTRKQIAGIDDLGTFNYKETEMNDLAAYGVAVLVNEGGIIRVRHALTTDTSNVNKAELQVVNIKDTTRKQLRLALRSVIGTKFVPAITKALLAAGIASFCDQKVSAEVYSEYRNITVAQSLTDPRIATVHFEFKPVYTLTWVDITFGVYTG